MAVAQTTLINRTRQILGDNAWETKLDEAIASDTDETVVVPDGSSWAIGSVGEFQDDGEQFLVRSISGTTLTVKRGHGGTTASSTHAVNTVILKDPRYTRVAIVDALGGVIKSLWPHAWKKTSREVIPDSTTVWFDFDAGIDLIQAVQLDSGNEIRYFGTNRKPITLKTGLPSALVASGRGLRFSNGFWHPTNTIYVDVREKLTSSVSSGNYSDIDSDLMSECIIYGAASRLAAAKELPRLNFDNDQDVPPQAYLTAGDYFRADFLRLRNQLHEDLLRRIPPMDKWRNA